MSYLRRMLLALVLLPALAYGASAQDKPLLGMPMTTLDDAFWVRYVDFAQQAADALGYELRVTDAQQREDQQLADIETLINAGAVGLILTPLSEPLGIRALEIAQEAGVPVVITDTDPGVAVEDFESYIAFIKLDDETAGYQVAQQILGTGARRFVGIGGVPGISTSEARNDGLRRAIEETEGAELLDLQYTDWTMAKGQTVMEDFLTRFDQIDAVWGAGSDPLLGALVSIEAAGRTGEMVLGGIDLTEAALEALGKGELQTLAGGHWVMGGFGILLIHDYLNGQPPTQTVFELELNYVAQDGVKEYVGAVIEPLAAGEWLVEWDKVNRAANPKIDHADVIKVIAP